MTELHVTEIGDGTRAVLVHGSLSDGLDTWGCQAPLADEGYRLVLPDRRGYGQSVRGVGEDYERDAQDLVALLGDGSHLVGHSYGALAALYAAAVRPEAVRSLVVIEPPAFGLVPDDPAVQAYMARFKALWARVEWDDREFLQGFLVEMGMEPEWITDELLDQWTPVTDALRRGRVVWDASVPVAVMNGVLFPTLVVSGGHSAAFDAVCDALAAAMAAPAVVMAGAGHAVPALGEPFNAALLEFWRAAEAAESR